MKAKAQPALAWSLLPRLQLFEFHECEWFPETFRNAITEILRTLGVQLRIHEVIAPVLEEVLENSLERRVVDLCSGAGGPILAIQQQLHHKVPVLLTDKFPNRRAWAIAARDSDGLVSGMAHEVDATEVPKNLPGVRTLFNAFHHFEPREARRILTGAVHCNQAVAVFEITERSLFNTLSNFILSFVTMLVLMPKMRGKRASWWLFTYLIPVLPLAFGWDGFVSCLRSYTASEFEDLTEGIGEDSHVWSSGRLSVPGSPLHITYFIGQPVDQPKLLHAGWAAGSTLSAARKVDRAHRYRNARAGKAR